MHPGAGHPFQRRRLRYDHSFRLEAQYAVDKGIPWSRYLQDFDAESRAVVQAVLAESSLRCQLCGTAPWEWERDGVLHAGAFHAATQVCLGCAATDRARKSQENGSAVPGMSVRLVPEETALRRAAQAVRRPSSARERKAVS